MQIKRLSALVGLTLKYVSLSGFAVDGIQPTILSCPQDISQEVSFGVPSTAITWTAPFAIDNSGQPPVVTSSHDPGSLFSVGTTTVTYTFTDQASNSATCQFMVTVRAGRKLTL